MNEEAFTSSLKHLFPQTELVVEGPGDDCAVLRIPGSEEYLLASVDQVIEGIHFLKGEAPDAVAAKLVNRNISDIAAMGGSPQYALLTIAANPLDETFLTAFHQGIQRASGAFGMCVVGGDIAKLPSPGWVATLTILGKIEPENLKLRRTAMPGDLLCGTGCFGRSFPTGHHLDFAPRLNEGRWLGTQKQVHAMMDVSDGLLKDSLRMAADSGLALELDLDNIPRRDHASIEEALCDGEDYELIFAIAPDAYDTLVSENRTGTFITKLGKFQSGTPGELLTPLNLTRKGFDHFHENH